MAWCQPGDKPFSEPMIISLLTHICITLLCYGTSGKWVRTANLKWSASNRTCGLNHCCWYGALYIYHGYFYLQNSQKTPHILPTRGRYGVSFSSGKPDHNFTIVIVVLRALSIIYDCDILRVCSILAHCCSSKSLQLIWKLIIRWDK